MSQTATATRPVSPDAPPKMTYEEFLEWADEDTHAEWVGGEIIYMSPVSNRHQEISSFLIPYLTMFVQERHLGVIRFESFQMKLVSNLPGREPDILFISNARMADLQNSFLDGPADLVVEIVSPESVYRDTVEKFGEYQRAGVGEYWLLNPMQQTATFFVRGNDALFHSVPPDETGRYHSTVLEGLSLRIGLLWRSPPPTVREVLTAWDEL